MPVDSKRVQAVFLAAVAANDAAARAAILERECAGDAELRQRVEALLQADQRPDSMLDGLALIEALAPPSDVTAALAERAVAPPQDTVVGQPAADVEAVDLQFLQPSARPGSVGRLGHYEIEEVLGKGGFGTVFRAFDSRLHRVVAIKVLAPELAVSGTARKRFIREAQAAAAIKNDYVVAIHNVEYEHQPPYLVMEFVDGITLQDKLDKEGALEIKEILRIGVQMAEGLAAAHKHGLVHRDIKPGNILLENGVQRVKITDFGLAKVADDASVTQSGVIAGTPMYMSPEQADGQQLDHRSDLFSLGTVLYVMCTGRPPFRASGTMGVLKRVVEETPRPIREINSEIPQWLCAIVEKLHAKKPEARYQSAREVAEVLAKCLADIQLHGGVVMTAEPAPGDSARRGSPDPAERRARRGSPDPAERFDRRSPDAPGGKGDLRSGESAGSGDPRRARGTASAPGDPASARTPLARKLLTRAALVLFVIGFSFWPGQWLWRAIRNTGYMWLTSEAAPIKLVVSRDGQIVKEFGSGYTGFGVEPGQYTCDAAYDKSRWTCVFDFQTDSLLSSSGTTKETDKLSFPIRRGDYLRIGVKLVPRAPQVAVKKIEIKEPPDESGWAPLFNGKDLTGWKRLDQGEWTVENGELVGQGKAISRLMTERAEFGNFHLRGRAKVSAAPNPRASIWFRLDEDFCGLGSYLSGTANEAGTLVALDSAKAPPKTLATGQGPSIPPDTWFDFEIIADGRTITTSIDGKQTAQAADDHLRKGGIGIHRWTGSVVHFKNIEIKELPPEAPGWVKLFNGKDLTNWIPHRNWRVENNILIGSGLAGPSKLTNLATERSDFADFHLRVEARVQSEESNSGVLVRFNDPPIGGSGEASIAFGPNRKDDHTGSLSIRPINSEVKRDPWIPAPANLAKPNEWFTMEIIVRGQHIVSKVNGTMAAETRNAGVHPRGQILLQQWGDNTVVHFKMIEIKELPPEAPPLAVAPFDAAKAKEHQEAWAKHLGTDVEIINSIGMKLRLIPPGEFLMGRTQQEAERLIAQAPEMKEYEKSDFRAEAPQRRVRIGEPFFLGAFEVTVGQFRRFVEATGYRTTAERDGEKDTQLLWNGAYPAPVDETLPVTCVSAADAREFCAWLSEVDGKEYDLPSEEQWEYCCRAGTTTLWWFGDDETQAPLHESFSKQLAAPVGSKRANPFGLFDMHGNVREWTTKEGQEPMKRGGWSKNPLRWSHSAGRTPTAKVKASSAGVGFRVAIAGDPKPEEPGWVQLFNRKDLDGLYASPADKWKVVNGEIVGEWLDPGYPSLNTKTPFGDFHLRAEVKLNDIDKGGAGLVVRNTGKTHAQIGLGVGDPGRRTGSLGLWAEGKMTWPHEFGQNLFAPNTWFTVEVIARGKDVTVKVNGTQTAQATLAQIPDRGGVGLTIANPPTVIHCRKLEIKELPPEPSEWVPLFNGKDLSHWEILDPEKWTVQDSILKGKDRCFLFSKQQFGDFHLRATVRYKNLASISFRGNAGVHGEMSMGGQIFNVSLGLIAQGKTSQTSGSRPGTFPANSWHELELIVRGNKVVVKINGVLATEAEIAGLQPAGKIDVNSHFEGTVVEFKKIEIKELPPTPMPFAILAKDKRAETQHATLADAVKAAQSGDTIEIRGDGPFVTEPISLGAKALTIKAGAGARPVLQLDPAKFQKDNLAFLHSRGALIVEGLELQGMGVDKNVLFPLIRSEGASLRLANCRLLSDNYGYLVFLYNPTAEMVNCQFLTSGSSCLSKTLRYKGSLKIDNCLLKARDRDHCILMEAKNEVAEQVIQIRQTTLDAPVAFRFWNPIKLDMIKMANRPVRLESSGNVFATRKERFQVQWWDGPLDTEENARTLLRRFFQYADEGNLYQTAPNFCSLWLFEKEKYKNLGSLIAGLKDWQQFWDQAASKSVEGTPIFQGGDLDKTFAANPFQLQPADFRLAPGSPGKGAGPGGKDLGADVDLVGPGAAYEKWKKTKEYEEWRKQTDALMVTAVAPPPAIAPFDAAKAKEYHDSWARHLGVESEVSNSIGMKLRLIPPGEFDMGTTPEEIEACFKEVPAVKQDAYYRRIVESAAPRRRVQLTKPILFGTHEVTWAQFKQFVDATGHQTDAEKNGGGQVYNEKTNTHKREPKVSWRTPQAAWKPDWAAGHVSWNDAQAFCAWLSQKEGRTYRLPTEAEWEFGCRAGTTTLYAFGNELSAKQARLEVAEPVCMAVGEFPANAFGLHDMHGNVLEWCADTFHNDAYMKLPLQDPLSASPSSDRVIRGGNIWGQLTLARSHVRFPMKHDADQFYVGFRVACEVAQPFVIFPKGAAAERKFATLADAVKAAQSGDTIEIRGDGPFLTGAIDLGEKALTIRAAAGYRPIIQGDIPGKPHKNMLTTKGALVLEGLDMVRAGLDKDGIYGILAAHGPALHVANCRIVVKAHGGHPIGVGPSVRDCEIRNCLLLASNWQPLAGNPRTRLAVKNSVLAGPIPYFLNCVQTLPDQGGSLHLHGNTWLGSAAMEVRLYDPLPLAAKSLGKYRIVSSGNVFAGSPATSAGTLKDPCFLALNAYMTPQKLPEEQAVKILADTLDWDGDKDLHAMNSDTLRLHWQDGNEGRKDVASKTLPGLAKYLATGTVLAPRDVHFRGPVHGVRAELAPEDFRLADGSAGKDAGPGGKDLGADVDLVGPGEAYEKWRKTKEYEDWRKQLTP